MGEEVDTTKAGGVGEEAFTEEYVDVGLKEYDYSYKDYNEPMMETGEVEANMGPALSAVTDEGGVSRFASEAKKTHKISFNQIWILVFVKLYSMSSQMTCLSLPSLKGRYGNTSFTSVCLVFSPLWDLLNHGG